MARVLKLTKKHKEKRLAWAEKYRKQDFSKVLFTDESRLTLDGPDGWGRGWIREGQRVKQRLRRQQGGGGLMIWAGIIDNKIIGPFRLPNGIKINSHNYCNFLKEKVFTALQNLGDDVTNNIIFQQDNAPSHASRYSKSFLENHGFKDERYMDWPPNSPDLNCIENLWAMIKRDVHRDGRQFNSIEDLWEACKIAFSRITPSDIKKLTASMDRRLVEVLKSCGRQVKG